MNLLIALLLLSSPDPSAAAVQDSSATPTAIFKAVERELTSGSVGALAPLFGKEVSLAIRGGESGVFSSPQALNILKSWFSGKKPARFSFTRTVDSTASPYATGTMSLLARGGRESVRIYVALLHTDAGWVLSQFNIY